MSTPEQVFNEAYRLWLPDDVRAVYDMPSVDAEGNVQVGAILAAAEKLAHQGRLIDNETVCWKWSAWWCMQQRKALGETWVPSALQLPLGSPNGIAAPGVSPEPGQTAYDPANPPAGSLKVSIDPADFPPADPAVPVPTQVVPADYVGAQCFPGGATYFCLPNDPTPAGQKVADPRGTFIKVVYNMPTGTGAYYQKL